LATRPIVIYTDCYIRGRIWKHLKTLVMVSIWKIETAQA